MWGVQGKTLYRKTPQTAAVGYQWFQMAPVDWVRDTAKLLSKVCGTTLKTDVRKRKKSTREVGKIKRVRKNRGKIKTKQEKVEVLHGGVGLHTTAHGRLMLLQMAIPKRSSAHRTPHKGRTIVWGWRRSSYKPQFTDCNFPCCSALLRDGRGIWKEVDLGREGRKDFF